MNKLPGLGRIEGSEIVFLTVEYHSLRFLSNRVRSIRQHVPDVLIVSVLNSDEDPQAYRNAAADDHHLVLVPGSNLGFMGGIQFAVNHVPARKLVVVNPDCEIEAFPLAEVLASPAAMLSGDVSEGVAQTDCSVMKWNKVTSKKTPRSKRDVAARFPWVYECYPNGAFLIFDLDLLPASFFAPATFLYYEELFWLHRLRELGAGLRWEKLGKLRIRHVGGGSTQADRQVSLNSRRHAILANLTYVRQCHRVLLPLHLFIAGMRLTVLGMRARLG